MWDKFIPGHKCSTTQPIQPAALLSALIDYEVGACGGILSDEILGALESHAQTIEGDYHISLYAVSGGGGA
jgi:hypothetical protein